MGGKEISLKRGATAWFTGLSGAGKTTLSQAVLKELQARGIASHLLDAGDVREQLCPDLGFSPADRDENVRRLGFVANMLSTHGIVTLVAAMSPHRAAREALRAATESFLEVFVDAPLNVCEQRDPVGLYRRFRAGEIQHLSGVDDPYDAPQTPDVHCLTATETLETCVARVVHAIITHCS